MSEHSTFTYDSSTMAYGKLALTFLLICLGLNAIQGQDLSKLPNVSGQDLGKNKYAVRVKECYLKDKTKFDGCLFQFWQEVSPLLKTGIPELNIPIMDPLFLNKLDFNERTGAVKADAKFSNVIVVGASKVIPGAVKVDSKAKLVTINLKFPHLNSTGDYVVKGEIMFMPIDGSGKFKLNLANVDAVVKAHIAQKGTGVTTNKIELDFTIGGIQVRLEGLLGGDSVGDAINNMLNENSQEILSDIKPAIVKKFEQVFHTMTRDAFIDMPPDAFIA